VVGVVNGVATYGHWGRPVLVFPAERGDAGEFERRGMVGAVGALLEAGRIKLYCVDSFDHESWSNQTFRSRSARADTITTRRGSMIRCSRSSATTALERAR
jgi:esterase/lipase superfamily enzyme